MSDAGNGNAGLYAHHADVLRLEERVKVVDRETASLREADINQGARISAVQRDIHAVHTAVNSLGLSFNMRIDELRADMQKSERRIIEALARVT